MSVLELEREAFRVLEKIKLTVDEVVLVGTYALKAQSCFSRLFADCDVVVASEREAEGIGALLIQEGFARDLSASENESRKICQ